MTQLVLDLEGKFPKGSIPATIKVEPELGTYELKDKNGNWLGNGQLTLKCD